MLDRAKLDSLLSDDLGIESGDFPTTDDSLLQVAKKSLRASFLKKFVEGNDFSDAQRQKGEELFLRYNEHCRNWSLPPVNEGEAEILGEFAKNLYNFFQRRGSPILDLESIGSNIGLGPGANVGAKSYNFYSKLFDSQLTATSDHLFRIYRSAIFRHPTWARAENARNLRLGSSIVGGSRLFHVPKDAERTRTAATEPTLNMLVQKGIGAVIEARLRETYRIDLSTQPNFNRILARRGSRWGLYGTIDLKSASDCIAVGLCERFLPRDVFSWLSISRSPKTILPDGSEVHLHLMSSMGNGFTFPLQTTLFAALVQACYRVKGVTPKHGRRSPLNYGVFGDDIIVRKDMYATVVRMLQVIGFFVNEDKSFNVGPFRESCGGDFWRGHDIRGVYLKEANNTADVYSIINRLARWSARWVPLYKTIGYLMSFVEKLYVPLHCSDDQGLKVSLRTALERSSFVRKTRTFQSYRYKYLEVKSYTVRLRQPHGDVEVLDSDNFGLYYNNKLMTRRSIDSRGNHLDPVGYNPDGLLVALLGGYIRYGVVTLRKERLQRKVVCGHTSFWDSTTHAGRIGLGDDWQFVIDELLT